MNIDHSLIFHIQSYTLYAPGHRPLTQFFRQMKHHLFSLYSRPRHYPPDASKDHSPLPALAIPLHHAKFQPEVPDIDSETFHVPSLSMHTYETVAQSL